MRTPLLSLFLLCFLAVLPCQADQILTDFEEPFLFTYLGFDDAVGHEDGKAIIQAKSGKGGAGIQMQEDWSAWADHSPTLLVRLLPENKASTIKLQLQDAQENKLSFSYELSPAQGGEWTQLFPDGSQPFDSGELDLTRITGLHIQGDWKAERLHVSIDKVAFVAPTEAMLAERKAAAEKERQREEWRRKDEERKAAAREKLLTEGAQHPEDGAEIIHFGMANRKLLGIELQDGAIVPAAPVPYELKESDELVPSNKKVLAWNEGKPQFVPMDTKLRTDLNGNGRNDNAGAWLLESGEVWREERTGTPLHVEVLDEPRAYRVSIDGGEPFLPKAIYRKSKPNGIAMGVGKPISQHFIYLELPEPVAEGSTVELQLLALNTREASVSFTLNSELLRSESIHVSHLGYRRDDPFKRAYLSLWTGTGGGQSFDAEVFHLVDENGEQLHTGKVVLGIPADQSEPFSNPRNHSGTNVYHLDFSDFNLTGTYVVQVPGLGVSYPFEIREGVWQEAFQTSMHGFLTHRSGIELGPPFTDYVRPRPMHPDDGLQAFQTDVNFWFGEADAIAESMTRLLGEDLDPEVLEPVPEAWGGYMDAGDWDRRTQHLIPTLRHLELAELFPEFMADLKLALPESEANNDIPDIIDEALWNIDCYRRLQHADGGIPSGIESTAHPRDGEASWEESLLVGVYKPDPESSFVYAAVASKAARLLKGHERSQELWASALRAWDWANTYADDVLAESKERGASRLNGVEKKIAAKKALAAAEIYHLTGDSAWHDAFKLVPDDVLNSDADVAMSYALIPEKLADAKWQEKARQSILKAADAALNFSEQNGFNIALSTPQIPMMGYTSIWSTPGAILAPTLPRAHWLTGDERYLAGTLAACHYSGGANPMNMSYTTGIGPRYPQEPLHIDHRVSGQKAPAGITVYGQSDPSMGYGFDEFAHTWFLNQYGGVNSKEWPTAEAYVDLGTWPAMNEYTIQQTLSPTSYFWGYLAARE